MFTLILIAGANICTSAFLGIFAENFYDLFIHSNQQQTPQRTDRDKRHFLCHIRALINNCVTLLSVKKLVSFKMKKKTGKKNGPNMITNQEQPHLKFEGTFSLAAGACGTDEIQPWGDKIHHVFLLRRPWERIAFIKLSQVRSCTRWWGLSFDFPSHSLNNAGQFVIFPGANQ